MSTNDPLARLSALLARLPGIGPKSANRLALAVARSDGEYVRALAESLNAVQSRLRLCSVCCDFTVEVVCDTCANSKRDASAICVIAQPQDRLAIERTSAYSGHYHVLHGLLDPLAGIGPAQLKVETLLARLRGDTVHEVILATSPSVEGDATALYLAKLIGPLGIRVSRIASGVAVGGELEYADATTLMRAFQDRRAF